MCAVSVITAVFSLLFATGNAWNITESEQCILASSKLPCDVIVVVICCGFLLPPTLAGECHSFPHVPKMCVVSVMTAVFSLLFTTGNAWNITVCE